MRPDTFCIASLIGNLQMVSDALIQFPGAHPAAKLLIQTMQNNIPVVLGTDPRNELVHMDHLVKNREIVIQIQNHH